MSNDEYIYYQQQRQQQKKQQEQANTRKIQDQQREQGFNVYFGGANQERIQQNKQPQARGGARESSGQRRQWRQNDDVSPVRDDFPQKYHNPFEVQENDQYKSSFEQPQKPSGQKRQQWGQPQASAPQQPIQVDPFASDNFGSYGGAQLNLGGDSNSEDSIEDNTARNQQPVAQTYHGQSDSDEPPRQDSEEEEEDFDFGDDDEPKHDQISEHDSDQYSDETFEDPAAQQAEKEDQVQNLLMTATAEQLDVLRHSLTQFKQPEPKPEADPDYIEEIFEDEDEANEEDDSIIELTEQEMIRRSEEEERKRKLEKLKQMSANQVSKKPARPISATYNLQQFNTQKQLPSMSGSSSMRQIDRQQVISAVHQENRQIKPQFQPTPVQQQNAKQAMAANPFKQRPVSHLVQPKRGVPEMGSSQSLQTLKDRQKAPETQRQEMPSSTLISTTHSAATSADEEKKDDSQTIQELLKKIYKLDDAQRRQLFQILKEMESKGNLSGASLNDSLQKILQQPKPATSDSQQLLGKQAQSIKQREEQTQKQRGSQQVAQSNTATTASRLAASSNNELILKIQSTQGNPHLCGLTEIELFDENQGKITLPPACIIVKNHGKGPKQNAEKLINGNKLTVNEKHMWLGYLPVPPQQLEIHIYFAKSVQLEGLKIWNYNKSILDCTKGVEKLQVIVNQELKWEGQLDPGRGQTNVDFAKQIILSSNPNYKLPLEQGTATPGADAKKALFDHREKAVAQEVKKDVQRGDSGKKGAQPMWFNKAEPSPYEQQAKPVDVPISSRRAAAAVPPRPDVSPRVTQVKNDIVSAVSSVEKVIAQNQYKPTGTLNKPKQFVDESLDSLDFFKVTSMGRLQNKEQLLSQTKSKNYQFQPEQSQISQTSSRKQGHAGPQIVKSPFPEEFGMMPSPAQNMKKSGYKDPGNSMPSFDNVQVKPPAPVIKQLNAIPTSPQGQVLQFNVLTTWGDLNYLGLAGIEVYDMEGKLINISKISACPPDVNVLPGYGNDPRVVENLVDGSYFTNDDMNVWLTPFTSGEDHTITLDFGKKVAISMIRIWNYNKSRIHAYRGARLITAELDNRLIFKGEIKKGPGHTKDPEACCEIILFTDSDSVLTKIDSNDWINQHDIVNGMDDTQRIHDYEDGQEERPLTATKKFTSTEIEDLQFQLQQEQTKPTSLFDERPQTSAFSMQSQRIGQAQNSNDAFYRRNQEQNKPIVQEVQKPEKKSERTIKGRKIWINILESWGDLFYVGLNGLEVLNKEGEPIPITIQPDPSISSRTTVTAKPRDMNSIAGHGSDHRTLEKLFNDRNNTMDDRNMWLIPFNKGEDHTIMIDLGEQRSISGLKFYNYNKSPEDSLRGSRQVVIKLDDNLMTPKKGITLRKATGFMVPDLDIGQIVQIPFRNGWSNDQIVPVQRSLSTNESLSVFQEYDTLTLPTGFTYKFNFYSTHGDLYYIGLNGIQMYDQNGYPILKPGQKMCGMPSDIRHLPGMQSDIRTLDKLINGKNETNDDSNMWLAPFKNTKSNAATNCKPAESAQKREPNFVCFLFDTPTCISSIQLWNYTKAAQRGVNEFELEIDGNQVFRGFLKQAGSSTALFSLHQATAEKQCQLINFDADKRQNVLLMNERKIVSHGEPKLRDKKFVFDEQARPQTKAINNFM